MYAPLHNQVADRAKQVAFMREYNFAVLVSSPPLERLQATHLPVQVQENAAGIHLLAHLARANPQAATIEAHAIAGIEVLVIFSGPHAYIPPSWYKRHPSVPTWNYQAVHAYGRLQLKDSPEEKWSSLRALIEAQDPGYLAAFETLEPEFLALKLAGILAFEVVVERVEARYKLSQDRSSDEQAGIVDRLQERGNRNDHHLAAVMRQQQQGTA